MGQGHKKDSGIWFLDLVSNPRPTTTLICDCGQLMSPPNHRGSKMYLTGSCEEMWNVPYIVLARNRVDT